LPNPASATMDLAIHREQAGLADNLPNSFALYPIGEGWQRPASAA
jgi:hypothetical protein